MMSVRVGGRVAAECPEGPVDTKIDVESTHPGGGVGRWD